MLLLLLSARRSSRAEPSNSERATQSKVLAHHNEGVAGSIGADLPTERVHTRAMAHTKVPAVCTVRRWAFVDLGMGTVIAAAGGGECDAVVIRLEIVLED